MTQRFINYLRIFYSFYRSVPGMIVLATLVSAALTWYLIEMFLPGAPQLAWLAVGLMVLFLIAYLNARLKLDTANAQGHSLEQALSRIAALSTQIDTLEEELETLNEPQIEQNLMEIEQRLSDLEYWTIQIRRDRLADQQR